MLLKILIRFLTPLIINSLLQINGLSIAENELNNRVLEKLDYIRAELNRPVIPDEFSKPLPQEIPYYTNVWDDEPSDFYHPRSFNVYAGQKRELLVDTIFESVNGRINYNAAKSDVLASALINLHGGNLLVWSTREGIFLQKVSPDFMPPVRGAVISGIISLDYLVLTNSSTGKEATFLFVLIEKSFIQKILIFRVDSALTLVLESEHAVKTGLVKIRVINVVNARKYLVIGVRYIDIIQRISCTSDVFEVIYAPKLHLVKLQDILTSGAVDVEPFTINGLTFFAMANSFCYTSDIFIFDVSSNSFDLYQRLPLENATDFEFFSIGYRHFLASISLNEASIYEWLGESLEFMQSFWLPSQDLPVHEIRRWHNLRLPWKDQALLLLVRSSHSTDIIKWSKWEEQFVMVVNPACVSWLLLPNTVGIRAAEAKHFHTDLTNSKLECIFAENACAGVSVIPSLGRTIYVPEPSQSTFPVSKSKLGYRFWMKQLTTGLSCFIGDDPVIKASIMSYIVEDLIYIVIPFRRYMSIVVLKGHTARLEKSTVKSNVLHRLENYEHEVKLLESKLDGIKSRVIPPNVLTETREQHMTRPITFNTTVKAFENLAVDKLVFHEVEGEPILDEWDDKIKIIDQKLKRLFRILQDAAPLNEAIVMKNLYFNELEVKGSLHSKGVSKVTSINHIPILHFVDNAATIHQTQQISGTKTFTGKVEYLGDIKVINLIAGYHFPDDVLTTNTVQELKGIWKFDHTVNINEEFHVNLMNGIHLGRSVTSTIINHTIIHSAPKVFHDRIVIEGDVIVREINGIDIALLAQHAVSKNSDEIIIASKIFTKNVDITSNVEIGDTLNGFKIPLLNSEIVKFDQPAVIMAPKTFSAAATIAGHLSVSGLLNYQSFPNNFAIKKTIANIDTPKEFLSSVKILGNLHVDGFVNGIKVHDIATLHTNQEFPELTVFTDGLTMQSLSLTGTVDGITMEDLDKFATYGRPISKPLSQLSTLTVNGNMESVKYINGLLISDALKDTIYKDDSHYVLTGMKTFRQSINVTRLSGHFPLINRLDLDTDLLNHKTPHHVTGRKIFTQRVIFKEGLHVIGLIDNVNLTELRSTVVSLDSVQEIRGVKKFVDGFELNLALDVDGLIDSVKLPDDVLMKENPKAILAHKTFHKGIRGKIFRTNIVKLDGVNNRDWRRFETSRVTLSTEQIISGRMTLLDDVKIRGELKVVGKINNIDVHKLTNDAMLKSRKQTVTGLKTIGFLKVDRIETSGLGVLSTVDLRELNSQVVRVKDNLIEDSQVFHNIAANRVELRGKLNDIEIDHLLNDAVMREHSTIQEITGLKVFVDRITVHGNMNLLQVNNLVPSKDILSRTLPQDISVFYEFSDVTVVKNINNNGEVNNVDLSAFQRKVMKTNEVSSFHRLSLDNIIVNYDLNTTRINNIELPVLFKQAISRRVSTQITTTTTFLGSVIVDGNVHVNGFVNRVKLPIFVKDLVHTMGSHVISAPKTFVGEVHLSRQMDIETNLSITGKVKGVDLNQLFQKVVYTHLTAVIHGHKIFTAPLTITHDLIIDETINNISIPRDTMLLKGEQSITGTTTFEHIVVEGEVTGKFINNHVVVEEYKDTLFIDTRQPVSGRKIINNSVWFNDRVVVAGKTCGVDFSTNVMTVNSVQTVTGRKTFHHFDVIGNAHITSLNDHALTLSQSLWTTVVKPSYQAHYSFLGRTKFINVELDIPKTNVPSIDHIVRDLYVLERNLTSADSIYQCFNFDVMKPLEYAPIRFDSMEYLQSTELYGKENFQVVEIGENVNLISRRRNPCETATLLIWSRERPHQKWQFKQIAHSDIGTFHWTPFTHDHSQYLLAAEPNPHCGIRSKILRYIGIGNVPKVHCYFANAWFYQSAVMSIDDSLFVAFIRAHNETSIARVIMEDTGCMIIDDYRINLDVDFAATLTERRLFIFSKSYGGFWLFKIDSKGIPEMALHVNSPGLRQIVAHSTHYKQNVVIAKELENTGLNIIQILELDRHTLNFYVVKQLKPRNEEILDMKVFSLSPFYDQYLAVLRRKNGVSIMKLDGYETVDKVVLPIASALQMRVFIWNTEVFMVINPVGNSSRTNVYEVSVKGKIVRNLQCHSP